MNTSSYPYVEGGDAVAKLLSYLRCTHTLMDGWVDYLHFSFRGEHILFGSLRLGSFWTFVLSSLLVGAICLFERWGYLLPWI